MKIHNPKSLKYRIKYFIYDCLCKILGFTTTIYRCKNCKSYNVVTGHKKISSGIKNYLECYDCNFKKTWDESNISAYNNVEVFDGKQLSKGLKMRNNKNE